MTDEEITKIIHTTLDGVIDMIADKYITYAMPHRTRRLVSTTSIIRKIETQAMLRLIKDIEIVKET